ncbi:hypothetical protein QJQ45_007241 [Haematococcus lacustris]|nr:hypothetical protein QJQ45_007241 [Haematococcus lacustris]
MPPVPKHTRASRANGAKTQAGHEATKSMEQLTATHAALTVAHATVTAELLSSRELYSQLRERHLSLMVFVATAPSAHTAAGSLLTAAATDPNPMALEGQQWAAAKPKLVVLINKHIQALYEYLYEHSQLFFQLPHPLAAMGSSNALYAQKAAEQVLKQRDMRLQHWDVHQREKQQQQQGGRRQAPSGQQLLPFDPAVFDPYGTLQDFLDDILELAAGQPCSPGLRTHLVEFFGAAPSSNHAVESSLQHTKHGNSAKQGLDAMIGSINNKLDPGALANIDLADFEARL